MTGFTDAEIVRFRDKHRKRIMENREQALLCRRRYADRGDEPGDVYFDELHEALIVFQGELEFYRGEDVITDEFDAVESFFDRALFGDETVHEMDDVTAQTLASMIDDLDRACKKLGFTYEGGR